MKKAFIVTTVCALFAIGCGKDAKPLVDAAEKYATDSCACKDADCLKKAADAYGASTKKLQGEGLVASEEQAKKIAASSEKAVKCNTELSTKLATEAASKAAGAAGK